MNSPRFYRIFDYDRALLPNPHLAELERDVKTIDHARKRTGFTLGHPGWGLLYHILLSHLDRSRREILIETGTNQGCTSIVLAQALLDSHTEGEVLTFELDPANLAKAKKNVELAGVADRVRFIEGDTNETLAPAISELSDLRFAFLDASHNYNDVISEFSTIAPRLTDDALVIFDNTYCIASPEEDQRVNGALKEITRIHGGNLINLEFVSWFTSGLAIWQKKPKL